MALKPRKGHSDLLTLQEMFRVVGDQLTARDVRVLKFMFNGIFTAEFLNQIHDGVTFLQALEKVDRIDESNFKNLENYLRIISRHDLCQFLTLRRRTPVKMDPVTEYIEKTSLQRKTTMSLEGSCPRCDAEKQAVSRKDVISHRKRPRSSTGENCPGHSLTPSEPSTRNSGSDSTEANSQSIAEPCEPGPSGAVCAVSDNCSSDAMRNSSVGPSKRRCIVAKESSPNTSNPISSAAQQMDKCGSRSTEKKRRQTKSCLPLRQSERLKKYSHKASQQDSVSGNNKAVTDSKEIKKKATCDIRLRVRAEYCSHESALEGNIHSNKPQLIERQFEKFMQANTILKSRDLGSIICDIKFSDLTYLDAFWRDYINGSLLEALKGVFITETLKQAVGHEAIKLMVNVDEDDYESGRLALLQNLQNST